LGDSAMIMEHVSVVAYLDTNAALRYLWNDHPVESPPARRLVKAAPAQSLYLSEVVVAEVVWSMHKKATRAEIVDALQRLFKNESVSVDPLLEDAIYNYSKTKLDFADCLLAARSQSSGFPVISYDQGYRKFRDVSAQTPTEWLATNGL